MNRCWWSLFYVLWFAATAYPQSSGAQNNGNDRPDMPRAQEFFVRVQQMLKANDRKGLSNVIEYPLLAGLGGKKARINNRANFLKHFDEIFDKGVRCAILESSAKDVWGNSHGFSVDHQGQLGAIWFDDFSPPGTNDDVHATDFWTKGTFAIMTVNNGPTNHCGGE